MVEVVRRIRKYQRRFHEYLVNTPAPRAIEVAHRRWGKDEVVLAAECELAHKRIGTYWHCLPEYAQARKALWTAVNAHTGKRRIEEIFPHAIRESTNEQEMFIRLAPQWARDEDALRTRLVNQGIKEGSAAWNTEMNRLSMAKNDALDQLILGGRQQSINEILTERNQPLNEISAMLSGSQVAQPNFVNTPQSQVAGVDYAGMVRDNYNAQVKQQEISQSGKNAMMGGMFGLAGTLGGAALRGPYSFLPKAA